MIKVRIATAQDIPLIGNLAERSWKSAYREILSPGQIQYMLDIMYGASVLHEQITANENYFYYLLEYKGTACGFVGFEHHYEPGTTKLHRIYLLSESKGKGLGKAGIELVKSKAVQAGDHRIILNVNKANIAEKVYRSQGFQVYDEVILDIGNGYFMDDYLMEWKV